MASLTASSLSFSSVSCSFKPNQVSNLRKASLSFSGKGFPSHRLPSLRFRVACAAKPETVNKVVEIVKKQLALPRIVMSMESRSLQHLVLILLIRRSGFAAPLEVEIVMGLEEEFGICVEEESAQSITTVQEAADMIEKLLEKK
ncbi:Acyl carrier protein 1, chloroplastic [Sesamum angolense]|uniref:Acyl carrier protein 1, chloroplastic n=1 Tax=Sesamum angolense TaxID=2727404 RepID=A0AAE1W838_9LAMI|nr:Acyl carrier protein 1, chloroplastic [Sesamum angolense]